MNKKKSILLVDDDDAFCKTMAKLFERSGYMIKVAGDGREALDLLSKNTFDLILSDLRMPRLDGIELMEEIRRKKIGSAVVFLTGYGEVESYMDLMNMGAFEYLNKPVDVKEMFSVIRRALRQNKGAISGIHSSRQL